MHDRAFTDALPALLEKHDLTLRGLAQRCQSHFDGWGSIATLSSYKTGKLVPTMAAMERIAIAMDEDPEVFAEYRLAVARAQLDPEQVGLRRALDNLKRSGS